MNGILTIDEAAKLLGIKPRQFYNYFRNGEIKPLAYLENSRGRKTPLFRQTDVERLRVNRPRRWARRTEVKK